MQKKIFKIFPLSLIFFSFFEFSRRVKFSYFKVFHHFLIILFLIIKSLFFYIKKFQAFFFSNFPAICFLLLTFLVMRFFCPNFLSVFFLIAAILKLQKSHLFLVLLFFKIFSLPLFANVFFCVTLKM